MTFMTKIKALLKQNNCNKSEVNYKNSTSKYTLTADCTMELSGKTAEKKKEIHEYLEPIIKKYMDNPEKFIQYIRFKGLKVYTINNSAELLSFIGEEEGFITPLKGIKALLLNIMLFIKGKTKLSLSLSTSEMFIFNPNETEIYTVIRAFYKYCGFKNNLPGYDIKSQALFKKIYGNKNHKRANNLNKLSFKEVLACKEALARDLESINYTLKLSLEYEQSKKALKKIITDKNAKI